jgi:hypothetical protein
LMPLLLATSSQLWSGATAEYGRNELLRKESGDKSISCV